ncbi:hypothetical protein C8Q73DRAFT_794994 [Cubamyces lactineus]|nr:hypothetical protein C8Q73DRAFT_794994 [Cubamyces lactineus]
MQEHLNFWIKTIYKAHGSNASWEWLTMISPCVDILRRLVTQINADLGARQGVKHTSPDLERDITHLMGSLQEHGVYEAHPGRRVDSDRVPVPNVVALGCANLTGPLADFNVHLARLQRRCHAKPLGGNPYVSREVTSSTDLGTSSLQPSQFNPPSAPSSSAQADVTEVAMEATTSHDIADEEEYWREVDALAWDGLEDCDSSSGRALFTLETAGDVALDMDDLETEFSL